MDIDGSGIKRLTDNGNTDGLPIWSPDGQTIAFASDRKGFGFSGDWAIWAMNPDGSNQRMLFSLGGSLHGYVQTQQKYKGGGWEEERLSWSP
jgi:Tol biopolymer transport system component